MFSHMSEAIPEGVQLMLNGNGINRMIMSGSLEASSFKVVISDLSIIINTSPSTRTTK